MLCRGAATALLACSGAVSGEPAVTNLPQWVLRAQERLGLQPEQQRDLRLLVDANAGRLRAVGERHADGKTADSRQARLQEMADLQIEFRAGLNHILTAAQLAEWDALIEELLGQLHRRNLPRLVESTN